MSRPLGITLLGSAAIALGMLGVVVGSCFAAIGVMGVCNGAFTTLGFAGSPASLGGLVAVGTSLLGVLAALVVGAIGVDLLQVRVWAWISAVILSSLLLFLGGAVVFTREAAASTNQPYFAIGSVVAIVAASVVLAYLLVPHVRAAFGLEGDASSALRTPRAA